MTTSNIAKNLELDIARYFYAYPDASLRYRFPMECIASGHFRSAIEMISESAENRENPSKARLATKIPPDVIEKITKGKVDIMAPIGGMIKDITSRQGKLVGANCGIELAEMSKNGHSLQDIIGYVDELKIKLLGYSESRIDAYDQNDALSHFKSYQSKIKRGEIRRVPLYIAGVSEIKEFVTPEEFVLFIAAPGDGKSINRSQWVDRLVQEGHNVIEIDTELSLPVITARRISKYGGIPYDRLFKPEEMTAEEKRQQELAEDHMRSWPGKLFTILASGLTMNQVCAQILHLNHSRPWKNKGPISMIALDYFQSLRHEDWSAFSLDNELELLKTTGKMVGAVTTMFGQIDKASRGDKPVGPSAFKGSGGGEEKANVIITLKRDVDEDGNKMPTAKMNIAKNTNGPTGVRYVALNSETWEFE